MPTDENPEKRSWLWVVPVSAIFILLLTLSILSSEDFFLGLEWVKSLREWGLQHFVFLSQEHYPDERVDLEIKTCLIISYMSTPLFVALHLSMKHFYGTELSVLSKRSGEKSGSFDAYDFLTCLGAFAVALFFARVFAYVAFLPGFRSFSSPFNRAYALTLVMSLMVSSICGLFDQLRTAYSTYLGK